MIGTKRTRVRCDRTYTCLHLIRIVTRLRLIVEQTLEDEDIDQSHEILRYQGEPQQWHPPHTQSESSKPIATSHYTSTSTRRVTQALPLVSTRLRRRGVLSSPFLSYQAKITSQLPPQSFISQPIIYQSSHAMKTIKKMSSPDYVNSKRLHSLYEECSLHHTFNQSKSSLSDSESSGRLDVRR